MADSRLVLHCGARPVTAEELQVFRAPPPQGRWFPLSHSRVLGVVTETLREAGFTIARQQLGVMRGEGSRFFGVMDLASTVAEGVTLAVGIRNSVDKSFPLGFCAGSRVFCCDNLAFRSELLVRRKHTLHGERDFVGRIAEAVASLDAFREQEAGRIERLKGCALGLDQADALLLRAYERGILGARELPRAIRQWREPDYDDFKAQTAWSLFNACTAAMRDRARSNPQQHAVATMRLHQLLDPERN